MEDDPQLLSVGISERIGSDLRPSGVLKHRHDDFHVHEVATGGVIKHLTHLLDRSTICQNFKSKSIIESGEDMILTDSFSIPPDVKTQLTDNFFFANADLTVIEAFIQELYKVSDLYENRTLTPNREAINFKCGPHCLITGDFESYKSSNSELSDSELWKELRRSIHAGIREHFPFLSSDTLSLDQISLLTKLPVDDLQVLYIPTDPPGGINYPLIKDTLEHLRTIHGQSTETIDQFSRAIRLCPKPPALKLLFTHLQPGNRTATRKEVECVCVRRQQKGSRWRQSRKPNVGEDGTCRNCGGYPRAARIISHTERWPKDRPPYLHFHLWKQNRDTQEALNNIAQCLGVNVKNLSVAGTKDRRAITVQSVTAYKVSEELFYKAILRQNWDRNIRVGDFSYVPNRIGLGSLEGNYFRVVIRDLSPADCDTAIQNNMQSLMSNGFINYFGLQRFGQRQVKTHQVGLAIVKEEFKKAVRLILGEGVCPSPEKADDEAPQEAAEPGEPALSGPPLKRQKRDNGNPCQVYLDTGDAAAALRHLPKYCYVEKGLLTSLEARPTDFVGALSQLPRNILTLYVHAVQSLIWNHAASARISQYGKKVIIGDYCVASNVSRQEELVDYEDQDLVIEESNNIGQNDVTLVTEENIGQYELCDVVLPIPGEGVSIPEHLKPIYEQVCEQHAQGISIDQITNLSKYGLGRYYGSFRKLVIRPTHVSSSIAHNVGMDKKLLNSDLDRLLNRDLDEPSEQSESNNVSALILTCGLPKGAYLTMALREVVRVD